MKVIFFCSLTLTFFPVSFATDTAEEGQSPPKKRKTTHSDARDSSVELGEEDSFSVQEHDEGELDSSFLEDGSILGEIREHEDYPSPPHQLQTK